jgi:hypothetical protein
MIFLTYLAHNDLHALLATQKIAFPILMGSQEWGKKSSGLPFMPLLHNAFLALFGAPGRPF